MKNPERQFSSSIYETAVTQEELESIENPIVRKITTGLLMEMSNPLFLAGAFGEQRVPPVSEHASSFGEGGTPPAQKLNFGAVGLPHVPESSSAFGETVTPPNPLRHATFGEQGLPPVPRRLASFGEFTTPPAPKRK